jgi:hypothetical protein
MTHPPRALSRALALVLTAGALALVPGAAHAADPVDGAQTSGDTQFPNVGNGGYDVTSYDINMVWTPATLPGITNDQSINATTTITAATTGAPLKTFSLDFEGLTVGSVTVNGAPATFTRSQNAAQIKYKLVITPATPVDGVFTTVVTYSGTPVAHTDADSSKEGWNATSDGAIFVNQPVGSMTGFPNNNTPTDKATYKYTINIPTTIGGGASAAVANGVLTSKTAVAGSRTVWVWDVAKPMPSFLSLISIGRYDMHTSDIDVAGVGTVKEWSFVDPTAAATSAYNTARGTLEAKLEFLSARYGAYPGNATGLVVDNVLGTGINYALETQDRPFFTAASLDAGTVTHELMHQWFGNNVSPTYWSDLWISEGSASYSSDQYTNEAGTETTFYNEWNSTAAGDQTWTTPAADPADNDSSDLFEGHVYRRGAMSLEALRTAIGATTFLDFMKEWQTRYAGTARGTEDFFALAEEVSGKELTAFFTDWIYETDKPAWPGRFNLSVSSTPASGTVAAGDSFSYTLTATNTGKVSLTGKSVRFDLADVLDDAAIGTLPANTTLDGSVLTWNVPSTATSASSTAVIPVTVDPGTTSGTMTAVASVPPTTLGGTCTSCTSTLGAGLEPVSPTADPTIDGTAKVGRTLSALTDGWAGTTTFSYQWKRAGVAIDGATASAHVLGTADLGAAITVTVVGSKPGFSPVTRTSAPTAPVAAGDQVLTPTPTVSGTAKVGDTLTATVGTWDAGVTLAYQWNADETAIPGADDVAYAPVADDLGKTLTFTVTGTKPGYVTQARTSAATDPVAQGTQTQTPTPTITGTPKFGSTLTAVAGDWDPGVATAYQWSANGAEILGATGATYTPVIGDIGKTVTVTVTGTRSGYATVARTSEPTAAVAAADQSATPTPTVSGSPRVGQTLTAHAGSWDAGTTQTYEWAADGSPIAGATSTTYVLVASDLGKRITFTVTSTRDGFTTVERTSVPTAPVAKGTLATGPVPTIRGKAKVGKKLRVLPGAYPAGVTLTYQWYVGSKPVAGATATSFKVRKAHLGARVSVRVSQSKPGYQTSTVRSRRTAQVV